MSTESKRLNNVKTGEDEGQIRRAGKTEWGLKKKNWQATGDGNLEFVKEHKSEGGSEVKG